MREAIPLEQVVWQAHEPVEVAPPVPAPRGSPGGGRARFVQRSWRRGLDKYVRRPYTSLVRSQRLELRLTPAERELDDAAATAVGETLSDFFRRAATARANEVLADQSGIALSAEEAARFVEALDQPDPETVARLRELPRRV